MGFDDYKVILYRNHPAGWVAEIPSIPGCYALMSSRTEALSELEQVFAMIEAEYRVCSNSEFIQRSSADSDN